jgi:uridine phosphorylase
MLPINNAELILNERGAIYHLNLKPNEVAPNVILVGDPDRVASVSAYFDSITHKGSHREFITHTGLLDGTPLSVISTGIGTDNIDIVLNELDALYNISFETKTVNHTPISLNIIRLGTAGSLDANIAPGDVVISQMAFGFDALANYYPPILNDPLAQTFSQFWQNQTYLPVKPYCVSADSSLLNWFSKELDKTIKVGITASCSGFYAPQGRKLRLPPLITNLPEYLSELNPLGQSILNFEMETSGIYLLSHLLGHKAISLSAILANRPKGTFSLTPEQDIDHLIKWALSKFAYFCKETNS